ncbi:tRNA epoxyqueuosine(34) reductase QueG [Marinospirillum perlucidum]|uniref:tRNA epoxyqueuosine(34) reductase QueG n=1 Tax=Marinospirillum perlucidum TaxID=1982602 RepID=UPI000DF204CA|nr:tRNA epoxyqueuosine(34) reductase QueG [Marinospirillum perlucidum]
MIPLDSQQQACLADLAQQIKDLAKDYGFAATGISSVDLGEHPAYLKKWLDAGYEGEMQWMHRHLDKRCDPAELEPGTLAVVTLRMDYLPPETETVKILGKPEKAYISRYAVGRDYHKLVRKRLAQLAKALNQRLDALPELREAFPELKSRAFTDSAPVLERALAQQGGLGWIGKNCMLITPKAGSWFFLGELYLNLPLPPDPAFGRDHCGQCSACHSACPTDAFVADGVLDATRCISYLTIELKGSIPEELRPLMGNRIFGCDDCQLVCPWNRFAKPTAEKDFHPRHQLDSADLVDLFAWDETTFLKNTEGSTIRRTGYISWLRNLAVALGNAPGSTEVIQALQARADHPEALVREHVSWALKQHRL